LPRGEVLNFQTKSSLERFLQGWEAVRYAVLQFTCTVDEAFRLLLDAVLPLRFAGLIVIALALEMT